MLMTIYIRFERHSCSRSTFLVTTVATGVSDSSGKSLPAILGRPSLCRYSVMDELFLLDRSYLLNAHELLFLLVEAHLRTALATKY